ncbi:MAG TPA: substrate-binding domain-containing protein [Anaerolineae bacterium]|mgnify:CR=1 FL=1|nr:substrate-binding domain-containing protein [Anaerolineae bacterium]HQK14656.1 substrate-binding domain-containing protein [Anaerolineae bacterium]
MAHKKYSRRDFLRLGMLATAGTALVGCATPTPQVIKETVEKLVEKTVEVEKVVEKTVEVEKKVEVMVTPPPKEPVELRIAWWGGDARATKTIAVIQMFQDMYPHITMLYEFAGWDDHWTKMGTQAAGGNLPDIMQHDYERIRAWVANGLLTPLDAFVESGTLDFSNVADNTLAGGRVNGKLYGVSLGTNSLDMDIAVDLFEEAGIPLPAPNWTWSDFEETCYTIKEKLGIWGYAGNSLFHDHMWKQVYMSKGEWVFAEDGKSLGYEDDQPAIDQLNMILRLYKKDAVQTLEDATARQGETVEQSPMITKQCAMGFSWSNFIVTTWNTAGASRKFKLVPIPRSGDLPAVYVKPSMFFSLTRDVKHPEEAAMFINFFINSIPANAILMADRGVPVASHVKEGMRGFLSAPQAEMFDYLAQVEKDSQPVPPPDPVGWADVRNNVFYPEFHDPVLYGMISPEEGAAKFRKMANEILGKS